MKVTMHKECFPEQGWKVLRSLKKITKKYQGTLAGGTALALNIGHRVSDNLDFYTDTYFSVESLISDIRKTGRPFNLISGEDGYLFAEVDGIKFSLLEYDYPFIQETISFEGVQIADVMDIITMKLMAVSRSGTKSDFIDLYFVLKYASFINVAEHMIKRFGSERVGAIDIGQSLINFSGADFNPEPTFIKGHKASWDEVKRFFKQHSNEFADDLKSVIAAGR